MFNINPLALPRRRRTIENEDDNVMPMGGTVLPPPIPIASTPLPPPPIPGRGQVGPFVPSAVTPPFLPPDSVVSGGLPVPVLPSPNRTEQAVLNTPPPPKAMPRKGFWGRLGDIGESFLLSGGNPLVAGITAFNPNVLARFKDRVINEPQWLRDRKIAMGEAESLDEADRRDQLSELNRAQIENLSADNKRQLEKDEYERELKRRAALRDSEKDAYQRIKDATNQREDLTKAGAEYVSSPSELIFGNKTTNRGNIIPSLDNQGFYRAPSVKQAEERKKALQQPPNVIVRDQVDDEGNVTTDIRDPKTGALIRRETAQGVGKTKTQPQDKEARDRRDEAFKEYKRIKAIRERAAQLDEEAKHITDPEKQQQKLGQAQGEWDTVRREIEVAKRQYPEFINGYEGEGGYPHLEDFKEPPKTAPQTKGRNAKSSSRTVKTISSSDFDDVVKESFGGDREKALAEAKKRGWTIQ